MDSIRFCEPMDLPGPFPQWSAELLAPPFSLQRWKCTFPFFTDPFRPTFQTSSSPVVMAAVPQGRTNDLGFLTNANSAPSMSTVRQSSGGVIPGAFRNTEFLFCGPSRQAVQVRLRCINCESHKPPPRDVSAHSAGVRLGDTRHR
jgi:hypothetical protein